MARKIYRKRAVASKSTALFLIVVFILCIAHLRHSLGRPSLSKIKTLTLGIANLNINTTFSATTSSNDGLWRELHILLVDCAPQIPALTISTPAKATKFLGHAGTRLQNLVQLTKKEKAKMRDAHSKFVSRITTKKLPALAFQSGNQGIVTTASGPYLTALLVSLRMLRRTGCSLDVEVFVESFDDFTGPICQSQMPFLGAHCVLFSDIVGKDLLLAGITRSQLKIFAIIFSAFKDVLFIDADNLVIRDPSYLFASEAFLSKGLVTWPDFWTVTTSPDFFDISAQQIPVSVTRASTESGQVLISRQKQAATLLLATYYNFYGPSHYWPLLSQGAPGQGDKETYAAAASALKSPISFVSGPVGEIGHFRNDAFRGVAMAQYPPVTNQIRHSQPNNSQARPIFVHHHNPKLDPLTIFNSDAPRDVTGRWHRMWGSGAKNLKQFGVDLERRMWQELCIVTCDLLAHVDVRKSQRLCAECKTYTKAVFGREGAF
ncbi:MAG: hypothetical protein Q9227_008733 [Pyrenula ochraceoflavens]